MEKIEVKVLTDGKEVILREGKAPDIFQNNGYCYDTTNTESFVAAIQKFGSKENTVMAAGGDSVKAIVDCTIKNRPQDIIRLRWEASPEAKRWKAVMGKQLVQAIFVKFLEREVRISQSPVVESLLAQLKMFKVSAQIIGDYSMDDRNNYTFMYKIGDAEGQTKVPSLIQMEFPMIDEGRKEKVDIELEFIRPGNSNDKPAFCLTCPTWEDIVRESINFEVQEIIAALPGTLLIKGAL